LVDRKRICALAHVAIWIDMLAGDGRIDETEGLRRDCSSLALLSYERANIDVCVVLRWHGEMWRDEVWRMVWCEVVK
jgi:hypothetical protein